MSATVTLLFAVLLAVAAPARADDALAAFSAAIGDENYREPTQALGNAGSCALDAGRDDIAIAMVRPAMLATVRATWA